VTEVNTTRSLAEESRQTTVAVGVAGLLLIVVGVAIAAMSLPSVDRLGTIDPGSGLGHLLGLMLSGIGGLLITVVTVAYGVKLGNGMSSQD
jgi:hypothetical protein